MKKLIISLLFASAVIGATAFADTVEVTIDSDTIFTMKGDSIETGKLDAAAFIENDITMVPLRFISEALGAQVAWDEATQSITCTSGDRSLQLTIGETTAYIKTPSGTETSVLLAPPVIINDITLVPLRFISEGLDTYVEYVAPTRQVLISNDEPAVMIGDVRLDKGMFKAFYQINAAYASYYGDNFNDMIYSELTGQSALARQWAIIDPSNELPPEEIAQLASMDEADMVKSGFLKAYFAKIIETQNSTAKASNMLAASFDDATVKSTYDDNYLCAKHILILTQDSETGEAFSDSDKKKALKNAQDILKKVKKGDDFDTLMKELSEDPGSHAQPDGYVFTTGEMVPEFEGAVLALDENAVSEIVETSYGYHIIKRIPLPEITDEVKSNILSSKTNELIQSMIANTEITDVMDRQELYSFISSGAAPAQG